MKTSDFFYDLPKELIAQSPAAVRSASRLLVYDRANKTIRDGVFTDILDYFRPGDVLVRNITRVIPARLHAYREDTGGAMEFLLLRRLDENRWECLVRPGRRAKTGLTFKINDELSATILDSTEDGGRIVRLNYDGVFEEILDRAGEMPLPPYITERTAGKERYPTAGLHFTTELLDDIRKKGVTIVDVLLHVGLGTFRPVSEDNVEDHHMHSEYCECSEEAARAINEARARGGRVFAVGTTSCRTLESVTDDEGIVHAKKGWTDIFITPGYKFKAVDKLITNFHLPESTLLMLVSALCTREEMLDVYKHAVEEKYRFFSFGDAMLIL